MLTKYSEKYSDESDRKLVAFIYNDTDDDATVSCQDFIINNHKSDNLDSILYNEIIPAHTMYITTEFDDAYLTKYYDEKYTSLQASLTFSFSGHQENDFSTGYITFSKE